MSSGSSATNKQYVYYGLSGYGKLVNSTSTKGIGLFFLTKYPTNTYGLRHFKFHTCIDFFKLYLKNHVYKNRYIKYTAHIEKEKVNVSIDLRKVKLDQHHFTCPNKNNATIRDVKVTIPVRFRPLGFTSYWQQIVINIGDLLINDCYLTIKNTVTEKILSLDKNFPETGYVYMYNNLAGTWFCEYK